MEDAATAEISRTQLWQWLRQSRINRTLSLADGTAIDSKLLNEVIGALPEKLAELGAVPGAAHFTQAIALLNQWCSSDHLEEFLTLPAYETFV
jgi:malate synthase